MIRVGDLERSLRFYGVHFGMIELRRRDVPEGNYTCSFLGYQNEGTETVLALTYNYGLDTYAHGESFKNLGFGVPDIYGTCDALRAAGTTITREPGPVKFGDSIIAFLRDPDGYLIELVQRV